MKHVGAYWGVISKQLRPALAVHRRWGSRETDPIRLKAFVRPLASGDSLGEDPFSDSGRDSRTESP